VRDPLGSDLLCRCALGVRSIPVSRTPIFCASCAGRFVDGFSAWSLEERTPLPSTEMLRSAINACWSDQVDEALITGLSKQLHHEAPNDGQPIFSSKLSIYVVEISLLQEALESRLEADPGRALRCSEYALDFYLQLGDLRREIAGVGPDYTDPGRDVREFEHDPEAKAECEHQLADAAALQSVNFDVNALRESSSMHGRRVLEEVTRLITAAS
jgi:hypothetical protein